MISVNKLVFHNFPNSWEEYLPLGNGRLGVMLKANPCNESLQLNEENIWSGGPQNRINPDTKKYLPEIKNLVKDGRIQDAQELAFETISGTSFNERVFQTAGNFNVDFYSSQDYGIKGPLPFHNTDESIKNSYESILDIKNDVAVVKYTNADGVEFTRKTWISFSMDMIFMYVTASKKASINFRGSFDRGIWTDKIYTKNEFIFLEDGHGVPFCSGAGVIAEDGESLTKGVCLTGKDCSKVLFLIDIQSFKTDKNISPTEYNELIKNNIWSESCYEKMNSFVKNFHNSRKDLSEFVDDLLEVHSKEYKSIYERSSLSFESRIETQIETPLLLQKASLENIDLVSLYYNFSKYLLISSSEKPGRLPSTLQGIWNNYMDPPWGSKYTININLEMNYWASNMCGLSDGELTVFNLLSKAYENGKIVAEKMYGCRGYVIHHNLDIWGDCAPQDCWLPGTYWVLGAAWLSTHIWEQYTYTLDKEMLSKYYFLMHEACRFFVDFLDESESVLCDGKPCLVINPSVSPENTYISKIGQVGAICEGSEMDNMILEHLFSSCISASTILISIKDKYGNSYNKNEIKEFEQILSRIKPPSLNKDGSLMEWNEEVTEVEPGHRHVSHLYGLFPGHTITPEKTPDLVVAVNKTLEKRLKNGGGHTGWSQSWIINFRASLYQGNLAADGIEKLFSHSTLPNLLDNHPPFQIDGNFGTLAGISRMIVQSDFIHESSDFVEINLRLLPSLPDYSSWQNGNVHGFRIKGNLKIDFSWKNGIPSFVQITPCSNFSKNVKVNIFIGGTDEKRKNNNGMCAFDRTEFITR
jgi:alpha-L-fucosidase 2